MCKPFEESNIYTNEKATLCKNSKGRKTPIPSDNYRTGYQIDVNRITYCQSFRRLRHKTQVFFLAHNDHICTRLEHSLYVASVSRVIARHLRLNEDLAEAIGLGHDLGHAPFGHHGESVLKKISKAHGLPPFKHEIHSLRVVDRLAELDRGKEPGLNLMYEVRDGIISHCGEDFKSSHIVPAKKTIPLEKIILLSDVEMPTTLEGAIVRFADKIAYAGRDVEDGLIADLIKESDIPKEIVRDLGTNNGEIVGTLTRDLIDFSLKNPDRIGFSEEKFDLLNKLLKFNYNRIYLSPKVEKDKPVATSGIEDLFAHLLNDLSKSNRLGDMSLFPENATVYKTFRKFIDTIGYTHEDSDAQIVLDFVSGFTDNYTIDCLKEIFVPRYII
jgi:dGTPase